ncbi:MAG: PKD domain-containing protein, partial [Bacteroidetes bacterium]|nr:PKD domain-containing protein [Bacteroidota bacterium]
GYWTYTGPGNATFADDSSNTTQVTIDTYGAYTFTWTEVNSAACLNSDQVIITFNPTISSAFQVDATIDCYLDATTVTYTGDATSAASYYWNFGSATTTGSGQGPYTVYYTIPGTHSVSLYVEENGCFSDTTVVSVVAPSQLFLKPNHTDNLCNGDCLAMAWMGAEGGTMPYSYTWSSGTDTLYNLCAGTYFCTVTDANGCSVDTSMTITEPTAITATTSWTDSHCQQNDGTATISPSGGTSTGSYGISWSDGQTTPTAFNLFADIYFVTVTDNNNCTFDTLVSIDDQDGFQVTLDPVENVSCFGYTDGLITVNVLNGVNPNFTYTFSTPSSYTTSSATYTESNLGAGLYTITVTDAVNCVNTDYVQITEPELLTATLTGTNVSCYGGSDGTVDLLADGGTVPYTFAWSSSQTTEDLYNIPAGSYIVVVTDDNSCTAMVTISITQPAFPLTAVAAASPVNCWGDSDGAVGLTPSGGTPETIGPAYHYQWSSGSTTQGISNIPAGYYSVVVTDANGCTVNAGATVTQPDSLSFSIAATPASCYGIHDGTTGISVSGGTVPYSYMWSNGIAAANNTYLEAGTYAVTVTDANGCTISSSATVIEPDELEISASPDRFICIHEPAELNASATGGTPGYTFYWSTGTGVNYQFLGTGTSITIDTLTWDIAVSVRAVDASGCGSAPEVVKIIVSPPITAILTVDHDSICEGEPVLFTVEASGGRPPYIYYFEGIEVNVPYLAYPDITDFYEISVEDSCTTPAVQIDTMITVLEPPPINFTVYPTSGCAPLNVFFNETNPYVDGMQYLWDFGDPGSMNYQTQKSPTHIYESPGVYDVELSVTSEYGCQSTFRREELIEVFPVPVASFEFEPTTPSVINPNVSFSSTSTGADTCYWYFGDLTDTVEDCSPVHAYRLSGLYDITLIVATEHGCRDTNYFESIFVMNHLSFFAPTAFSPDGDGRNDIFSPKINGLAEGTYHLYIYDRWGHLIYETNDYDVDPVSGKINDGWDGRVYEKGMAKTGVYVWYVVYIDKEGVEHEENGAVTVIR